MAMMEIAPVKARRIRLTKVSRCGLPTEGKSTIVTSGFVRLKYSPVYKDAEDIEQTNAAGDICIADRTAASLKWYEVELELCKVNPEIVGFFTDNPLVLDHNGKAVGYRNAKKAKVTGGVSIELWQDPSSDSCDIPEDDSALTAEGHDPYLYTVLPWVKEATIGEVEAAASVATMTLSGITGPGSWWGKGPYDVVEQDDDLTPGRLLTPFGKDAHFHTQVVHIAPPEPTDDVVELTRPTPYFAAAAVSPVVEEDDEAEEEGDS